MLYELYLFESPASRAGEAPKDIVYVYADVDADNMMSPSSGITIYFSEQKLSQNDAPPMEEPIFVALVSDYTGETYDGRRTVEIPQMRSDFLKFVIDELPATYADEYGIDEVTANDEYCLYSDEIYSPRNKQWDMMRGEVYGPDPRYNGGIEEVLWILTQWEESSF